MVNLSIVKGPSLWDLHLALFDNKEDERFVVFNTANSENQFVIVSVIGVQLLNSAEEKYKISGYVQNRNNIASTGRIPYEAIYSTHSRNGTLEL